MGPAEREVVAQWSGTLHCNLVNAAGLGLTPSCGRVQDFFTLKYRQKYIKKKKLKEYFLEKLEYFQF